MQQQPVPGSKLSPTCATLCAPCSKRQRRHYSMVSEKMNRQTLIGLELCGTQVTLIGQHWSVGLGCVAIFIVLVMARRWSKWLLNVSGNDRIDGGDVSLRLTALDEHALGPGFPCEGVRLHELYPRLKVV
eukprot:6492292-Amphidinium_carterae.2